MLHDLQLTATSASDKKGKALAMCQVPLAGLNCPTRCLPLVYPSLANSAVITNFATAATGWARADYSANAGSDVLLWWAGPGSWAEGLAGQGFDNVTASNGISYERSKVKMADITDGSSNTYLVGEKYLNPNDYTTGADFGDDHGPFASDSDDWYRWTAARPLPDTPGLTNVYVFGSCAPDRLQHGLLRRIDAVGQLYDRSGGP